MLVYEYCLLIRIFCTFSTGLLMSRFMLNLNFPSCLLSCRVVWGLIVRSVSFVSIFCHVSALSFTLLQCGRKSFECRRRFLWDSSSESDIKLLTMIVMFSAFVNKFFIRHVKELFKRLLSSSLIYKVSCTVSFLQSFSCSLTNSYFQFPIRVVSSLC